MVTDLKKEQILERINQFEDILKKEFVFLESLGYGKTQTKFIKNSIYRYWTEREYINYNINRRVSVDFFPIDEDGEEHNSIGISFVTDNPQEYDFSDDYLSFDVYLERKVPSFDLKKLEYDYYQGDFESRITQMLRLHLVLIQRHLLKVLTGKKWEKGYFRKWR